MSASVGWSICSACRKAPPPGSSVAPPPPSSARLPPLETSYLRGKAGMSPSRAYGARRPSAWCLVSRRIPPFSRRSRCSAWASRWSPSLRWTRRDVCCRIVCPSSTKIRCSFCRRATSTAARLTRSTRSAPAQTKSAPGCMSTARSGFGRMLPSKRGIWYAAWNARIPGRRTRTKHSTRLTTAALSS